MWCGICGKYTVHDHGICIHCKNMPIYTSEPTSPEQSEKPPEDSQDDPE